MDRGRPFLTRFRVCKRESRVVSGPAVSKVVQQQRLRNKEDDSFREGVVKGESQGESQTE